MILQAAALSRLNVADWGFYLSLFTFHFWPLPSLRGHMALFLQLHEGM